MARHRGEEADGRGSCGAGARSTSARGRSSMLVAGATALGRWYAGEIGLVRPGATRACGRGDLRAGESLHCFRGERDVHVQITRGSRAADEAG